MRGREGIDKSVERDEEETREGNGRSERTERRVERRAEVKGKYMTDKAKPNSRKGGVRT